MGERQEISFNHLGIKHTYLDMQLRCKGSRGIHFFAFLKGSSYGIISRLLSISPALMNELEYSTIQQSICSLVFRYFFPCLFQSLNQARVCDLENSQRLRLHQI